MKIEYFLTTLKFLRPDLFLVLFNVQIMKNYNLNVLKLLKIDWLLRTLWVVKEFSIFMHFSEPYNGFSKCLNLALLNEAESISIIMHSYTFQRND